MTTNFMVILPEIAVLGMTCIVLLFDLFLRSRRVTYYLSQFTILLAAALTIGLYQMPPTLAFHQMFILDPLASLL